MESDAKAISMILLESGRITRRIEINIIIIIIIDSYREQLTFDTKRGKDKALLETYPRYPFYRYPL